MSVQTCHCGWSKETTYQGLRTHQGRMGCTPKGLHIPQSGHFTSSPALMWDKGPRITLAEPSEDIFNPRPRPEDDLFTLRNHSKLSGTLDWTTQARMEIPFLDFSLRPADSDMSLQTCHCGWSKVTSYQGLRTHQGIKGCTPKGLHIPQSGPFTSSPALMWDKGPRITLEEPSEDIFNPRPKPEDDLFTLRNHSKQIGALDQTTQARKENTPLLSRDATPKASLKESRTLSSTTNMDATQRALAVTAVSQALQTTPIFSTVAFPADVRVKDTNRPIWETQQPVLQTAANSDATHPAFGFSSAAQALQTTSTFGTTANPSDVRVKDQHRPLGGTQGPALQTATNSDGTPPDFGFSKAAQTTPIFGSFPNPAEFAQKSLWDTEQREFLQTANSEVTSPAFGFANFSQPVQMSQIIITQVNNAALNETTTSLFETPQRCSTMQRAATNATNATNARRALDFTTSAEQAEQSVTTTTTQETAAAKPKESQMEKVKKAQRDIIRADLKLKIHARERKMAEVKLSALTFKCELDAEWVEINDVFTEAMKVMEDTRRKALHPLEERRRRVKRDAQQVVQTLQTEVDKLKHVIDELDTNPNFQVSLPEGLNESCDVSIDTSASLGTLRATMSDMMQQLHHTLDKLSSIELKRMPTFAVDVKLDPATAHPHLVLSPDGKMVNDGGRTQKVPDAPQRFDVFGSILASNRLTSGKSYWEVEVGNKSGWDLGVARRGANRKGKLSLSPDGGYWVTVHYEDKNYAAMAAPPISLALVEKPQKVGVYVDYEEGLVSFYDVTARSHIHSFTGCSFAGEISPYFSPHLHQKGKNSRPLIISAV